MAFFSKLGRQLGNLSGDIGGGLSSVARGVGGSVFGLARQAVATAPAAIAAYRGGGAPSGFPPTIPSGVMGGYAPGLQEIGGFAGTAWPSTPMYTPISAQVPQVGGAAPAGSAAATIIENRKGKGYPALPRDMGSLTALRNAGLLLRNTDLIHTFRSPVKGFVAVRPWKDSPTAIVGMERSLAIRMGLFTPGKKPLLSVRQTSALRTANTAIRALKRANKMAVKIANFTPGGRRALPAPPKKGK